MPTPFSRSLRSLEADRGVRLLFLLAVALVLVGGWAAWLVLARLPVYVQSGAARLEVEGEVHPVGASVGGRVVEARLEVDRRVAAGDVLVVLDTGALEVGVAEARRRMETIPPQILAAKAEVGTWEAALALSEKGREAAIAEAEARHKEAIAAARNLRGEVKRLKALRAEGLVSALEFERTRGRLTELVASARSLEESIRRVDIDRQEEGTSARARLDSLGRELARLEAEQVAARSEIAVLTHQIEQSTIRAPVAGTLGEVSPVKAGSVLTTGDRLAALVPDGDLKVVASFPAAIALGRIQPGQIATIRLAGFPWSQYGTLTATVARVAAEPVAGAVRVELSLGDTSGSTIPLAHGQPGEVEVEVERVSPAILALRAAGQLLDGGDEPALPSRGGGAPPGSAAPGASGASGAGP